MVLVDTPVWLEFYRRSTPQADVHKALRALVEIGDAKILGPVRQEILSGIKDFHAIERFIPIQLYKP